MSIDILPAAKVDLDDAAEDIGAAIGERVARLFQQRLGDTLRRLERFPLSVAPHEPPFPRYPGLRIVPVKRFEARLICYVPIADGIRVVRVLHSSRDLGAIFG